MGNRPVKPSPSITQTCHCYSNVPLSERSTPPTSSSQQPAPLSSRSTTPTTGSHAEWDECMRQSILTIGSTTVTAIVVGLMVPAADLVLLLGTGAGVLWSVKRCRTLMRDGIMSPEQSKALEHKRRMEREERKRQRKIEKEAKQKAEVEQKRGKQDKQENKKGTAKGKCPDKGSGDCCTKLRQILEQEELRSAENLGCEKLSHENEKTHCEAAKAITIGSQMVEELRPHTCTMQDDLPKTVTGSNSNISYTEERGESPKILPGKPEIAEVNSQQLESSGEEKHTSKAKRKTPVKQSRTDKYSTVKLFAPYSRYLSESVILTCTRKECNCNTNEDDQNCTCDPEQLSFGQPQQYTLATDADEDVPLKDDPESLIVHHINANANDTEDLRKNSDCEVSPKRPTSGSSLNFKTEVSKQPVREADQIDLNESEEDEEEVEVILSTAFDSIESLNDDSIEVTLEDNEDLDIKIEESQDGFDVEVMRNDMSDENIEQLRNEVEVVFSETFKSESWPFSFSLPSLDKFSKKKNNSFKWPPLTSSIIVKPKKEPTCTCPDGSETPKENADAQTHFSRGSSKNGCNCP